MNKIDDKINSTGSDKTTCKVRRNTLYSI